MPAPGYQHPQVADIEEPASCISREKGKMAGEIDLRTLLASMTPELLADAYVFATLALGVAQPEGLEPVMMFREREAPH